jgi:molybdate transport system ATP-binding protein
LFFGDGELRVPLVTAPIDSGVRLTIDARDVSIALSRPMDVSITNRIPGTIVAIEPLALPYVRVRFDLGCTRLDALVTKESVERLGLEPGLRAWAMIKTVAIGKDAVKVADIPKPRRWPVVDTTG